VPKIYENFRSSEIQSIDHFTFCFCSIIKTNCCCFGVGKEVAFFNRLKGIASGDISNQPCPTPRKRSNSVPMPKIEVTLSTVEGEEEEEELKSPIESVLDPSDQILHNRSVTKQDRKKSMIANIDGNRFKNFKTFVESKILSKSDRSLEMDSIYPSNSGASLHSTNGPCPPLGNGKLNGASGGIELTKKESFQRRRSHLSMYEIELTVRIFADLNY
jgi:hypothetical protein